MKAIPEMMRAAVLRSVGDLVVERRPTPRPGPRQVLVQVTAVGTCGSDVHYYEHGRIGEYVVTEPLVLGHEAAGVVVACGDEATRHEIGQRVSLEPGVPCARCTQCRRGHYNLCPDVRFFGTPPIDGAFQEYVVLDETFAHPVPATVSDEAAALLEPLSVGVWACRRARVAPGERILVTGAGPVGLLAAQAAKSLGATDILVTDIKPARLSVAEELGLSTLDTGRVSLLDAGVEADVLLECSGVPRVSGAGIRCICPGGRAVLIGMGADEIPLPLDRIQRREIEVTGTFRYANTWPAAIGLAASGAVALDRLVTHRFGLTQVERALTVGRTDEKAIKAVVLPQE
ncbi:sorbitol dehydrogenase [Longimycelium tulufanense]|uniref:Sorbitol dehydrogenase n=1 Tax=Longimycelium tulufanense TaxID=907463 RepID=A0A8J3CI90_9PSEU|nr:NAD(P)-dependent alcohol dehydrogenase [Longimycelium tulufanense]GGM72997.1 sorbitol dehydrogenase [Longimycelium tulufanense]